MNSVIIVIFSILSAALLVTYIYYSYLFLREKNKEQVPLRGIVKFYAYEKISVSLAAEQKKIMYFSILFSLVLFVWVSIFSWGTDYSFMILLFPLLWYYFVIRFFLWEKSDLTDKKEEV